MTALDLSRGEENGGGEVALKNASAAAAASAKDVMGLGSNNNVFETIVQTVRYDPESILNCPHDFPHLNRSDDTNEMEIETDSAAPNDANDSSAASNNNSVASLAQTAAALFIRPPKSLYNLPDCFQVFIISFIISFK